MVMSITIMALLATVKETGVPSTGLQVRRTHGRLTRALRNALAALGVGIGEFQILRALHTNDGLTQRELSDIVEVEKGALTRLFYSMERAGYIARRRDATDSRKINVFLTARGEAFRTPLVSTARSVNRAACRGVSREDLDTTMRVLEKITANLDALEASN